MPRATVWLIAGLLTVGCGGGDEPDPRSDARLVKGWVAALARDDFERAASYFAPGAVIKQSERFRLEDKADAEAFNRSLPCRSRVTRVEDEGEASVATFRLRPRPGAPPRACNSVVQVRFRAKDGKFVVWVQLPRGDSPDAVPA